LKNVEGYTVFPGVDIKTFLDLALVYLYTWPEISFDWARYPFDSYDYEVRKGDFTLFTYCVATRELAIETEDILPDVIGIHGQDYATVCQRFYNTSDKCDDILERAKRAEEVLCSIAGPEWVEEMKRRWSIYS